MCKYLFCALLLALGCDRQMSAHFPLRYDDRIHVVSLAPSLTEMICAIGAGDCLVGRTSACKHPAEIIGRVPVVGGFGAPSLEALAQSRPGLVLSVDLEDYGVAQAIRQLGIRYENIPCRKLDDIPHAIRRVGGLLGRASAANQLADRLTAEITALRAAPVATHPPAVFIEIGSDPLMTAGKNSFLSEMVALAGGRNLADDVDRDYFQISAETVLTRDPDVILLLDMADKNAPTRAIAGRVSWDRLKAVRTERVFSGLDADVLMRPGPRVLDGVRILQACLQRPVVKP